MSAGPRRLATALALALVAFAVPAFAEDAGAETTHDDVLFVVHNLWMLVATVLVFIMHLGFAALEVGLTRAKNTVNILFKNVCIVAIGVLTYAFVGFNLMYPGEDFAGMVFGFAGFGVSATASDLTPAYNPAYTYWTDFIFQAMFAATATAATIFERAKREPRRSADLERVRRRASRMHRMYEVRRVLVAPCCTMSVEIRAQSAIRRRRVDRRRAT